MTVRILLFIAGAAWGVQFIVFRARWTAWFRRLPGFVKPATRHEWFFRSAPFLFAGSSFGWALAMLSGVPVW